MGIKRLVLRYLNAVAEKARHTGLIRRANISSFYSTVRRRGLEIAYLMAIFILSAGIFNTLLEGSKPEFSQRIILPFRQAQNFTEFLINMFTILVGTGGVYLIYLSGRQTFRYRLATLYMVLGFTAVIIAVIVGILILQTKGF